MKIDITLAEFATLCEEERAWILEKACTVPEPGVYSAELCFTDKTVELCFAPDPVEGLWEEFKKQFSAKGEEEVKHSEKGYKVKMSYKDFEGLARDEQERIIDKATECGAGQYYCWLIFDDLFVDVRAEIESYLKDERFLKETGGMEGGPWAVESEFDTPQKLREDLLEKVFEAVFKGHDNVRFKIKEFLSQETIEKLDEEYDFDNALMYRDEIIEFFEDHDPGYKGKIMKRHEPDHPIYISPAGFYDALVRYRAMN